MFVMRTLIGSHEMVDLASGPWLSATMNTSASSSIVVKCKVKKSVAWYSSDVNAIDAASAVYFSRPRMASSRTRGCSSTTA